MGDRLIPVSGVASSSINEIQTALDEAIKNGNVSYVGQVIREVGKDELDIIFLLYKAVVYEKVDIVDYLAGLSDVKLLRSSKYKLLHKACNLQNLKMVECLLNYGLDVNELGNFGDNPLHTTLNPGRDCKPHASVNIDVVKTLILRGVDINQIGSSGMSPLHLAVCSKNIEAVSVIINNKDFDGDCFTTLSRVGKYPIWYAIDTGDIDIIRLLLSREKVFASNKADYTESHRLSNGLLEGWTAVHRAAAVANAQVIALLVEQGALVEAQNDFGDSPLHVAVEFGNYDAAKCLLVLKADVNCQNFDGMTPLHMAGRCKSVQSKEIVLLLLENGANIESTNVSQQTPLHIAAKFQNTLVLSLLLSKKANANAKDVEGKTPLHVVSECRHYSEAVCMALIENGAVVDSRCNSLVSPLHSAVELGNVQLADLLLRHKADVNAEDIHGSTPLHFACRNRVGVSQILQLLINNGCNVHARNGKGQSGLHCSINYFNVEMLNILIEKGVDVNAQDILGQTVLHLVPSCRDLNSGNKLVIGMMASLLENGADVEAKNNKLETPLHKSIGTDLSSFNLFITDLLLNLNADASATRIDGDTPLHLLLRNSTLRHFVEPCIKEELIKMFRNGGNLFVKNNTGISPLDIIIENHHQWPEAVNEIIFKNIICWYAVIESRQQVISNVAFINNLIQTCPRLTSLHQSCLKEIKLLKSYNFDGVTYFDILTAPLNELVKNFSTDIIEGLPLSLDHLFRDCIHYASNLNYKMECVVDKLKVIQLYDESRQFFIEVSKVLNLPPGPIIDCSKFILKYLNEKSVSNLVRSLK